MSWGHTANGDKNMNEISVRTTWICCIWEGPVPIHLSPSLSHPMTALLWNVWLWRWRVSPLTSPSLVYSLIPGGRPSLSCISPLPHQLHVVEAPFQASMAKRTLASLLPTTQPSLLGGSSTLGIVGGEYWAPTAPLQPAHDRSFHVGEVSHKDEWLPSTYCQGPLVEQKCYSVRMWLVSVPPAMAQCCRSLGPEREVELRST